MTKKHAVLTPIHPHVRIGHIHLSVSDIAKALEFYQGVLGFEVTQRWNGAVFLSAGGYHHHIGLNTWGNARIGSPKQGHIGVYHVAILYPNRKELADALRRLISAKYPIQGVADHGVSEAIYLSDPDGNGIELYWDKPKEQWPYDKNGELQMVTQPLDVDDLLCE